MSKVSKQQPLAANQKSLFSFFKKAPVQAASSDAAVPAETSNGAEVKKQLPGPIASLTAASIAKPLSSADSYKVQIGDRLSIFWPNDDEWYPGNRFFKCRSLLKLNLSSTCIIGIVSDFDAFKNQHTIKYDDGQVEKVTLSNEKYKVLQMTSKAEKTKSTNETTTTAAAKRTRRVVGDDDEDEDETALDVHAKKVLSYGDEEEEWDGEDSKSGVSASASAYSDEDDDEDSASSEDEDDDSSESAPKKRKASSKPSSRATKHRVTATVRPVGAKKPQAATPSSVATLPATPATGTKAKSSALTTPLSVDESASSYPASAEDSEVDGVFSAGHHEHDSWDFLKPNHRKDKNGRRPDHPEYNPRTLYVPPANLAAQTPAMKQWFDFKQDNMDTVLFFKVGKFYELFHMDSDTGVKEIDLIYMRGYKAHSGFPEVSYGKYSSQLVGKGLR